MPIGQSATHWEAKYLHTAPPTTPSHRNASMPPRRSAADATLQKSPQRHLSPKRVAETRRTPSALSFESRFPAKRLTQKAHFPKRATASHMKSNSQLVQNSRTDRNNLPPAGINVHSNTRRRPTKSVTPNATSIKHSAELLLNRSRIITPTPSRTAPWHPDTELFNLLERWSGRSVSAPAD